MPQMIQWLKNQLVHFINNVPRLRSALMTSAPLGIKDLGYLKQKPNIS